jgi:hypothetical protein
LLKTGWQGLTDKLMLILASLQTFLNDETTNWQKIAKIANLQIILFFEKKTSFAKIYLNYKILSSDILSLSALAGTCIAKIFTVVTDTFV